MSSARMAEQDARGERIAHFRLLGPLGSGGMGVVFRALECQGA